VFGTDDRISAGRALAAIGLFSGGLTLGSALMIRQSLWLGRLGAICGHHGLFAIHCPGCYIAAVLMLAGVFLALSPAERRLARATSPAPLWRERPSKQDV
jgi:hypothetical protein